MQKTTFVIFHGAFGNSEGNWFQYLKNELEALGQEVILEDYPVEDWDEIEKFGKDFVPENQNLTNWLKVFQEKTLPHLSGKKLVFVGHSLGPVFMLHLVDKYSLELQGAVFVSPFLNPLKELSTFDGTWIIDIVNDSFYKNDFNFAQLQKNIKTSYAIFSDNDPYVDISHTLLFAEKMQSEKIIVHDGEHLNAPVFVTFPLVLELCKTFLDPKEYL